MNKFAVFAAVAATGAILGTAALAQSNTQFGRADGNNDGVITPTEAQGAFPTMTGAQFQMADSNHDGVLDETEYGVMPALMGGTTNSHEETPSSAAPAPAPSSEASSSEPPV